MIFTMAMRNIFRHKRRTFLTVFTIALGVTVFVWADGIYRGMHRQMGENVVKYADGSLLITTKDYAEHENAVPLKYFLSDSEKLKVMLKEYKEVEGLSMRVPFLAELIAGEKNFHVVGYVVDHLEDSQVFDLHKVIVSGFFLQGSNDEVIIGADLAQGLGVHVGEEILLVSQTKHGTMNALSMRIVGIFRTSHPALDESAVFLSRESGEALLDLGNEDNSILHVKLRWPRGESVQRYRDRVEGFKQLIAESLSGHRILSFSEKYAEAFALMKADESFMYIVLTVIFLIAAVGIVNTILMAIHERMKEIGVMRAMGFTALDIRLLFILEGSLMGVLGGIAGLVLGFVMNLYQIYVGYDMTKMGFGNVSGSDFGFPVWGVIYGDWNPPAFLFAFIFSLIVASFAAFLPVRYATKISITDCLRSV